MFNVYWHFAVHYLLSKKNISFVLSAMKMAGKGKLLAGF
ncbi:hypothetical protein FlaCF_1261 [Flavobacterium tructae]